jgi:hypothetical protein
MYIFHENVHCVFHSFFAIGMQFEVERWFDPILEYLWAFPKPPNHNLNLNI